MTSQGKGRPDSRPIEVSLLGRVALLFGLAMIAIALLWMAFSASISDAGAELMSGEGGLGVLAVPLRYAFLSGLLGLLLGVTFVIAGRRFLQGSSLARDVLRWILILGVGAILVWGALFLSWLTGQSRVDPDAPPLGAAMIIAVFPTLVGALVLAALVKFLSTSKVESWVNNGSGGSDGAG